MNVLRFVTRRHLCVIAMSIGCNDATISDHENRLKQLEEQTAKQLRQIENNTLSIEEVDHVLVYQELARLAEKTASVAREGESRPADEQDVVTRKLTALREELASLTSGRDERTKRRKTNEILAKRAAETAPPDPKGPKR